MRIIEKILFKALIEYIQHEESDNIDNYQFYMDLSEQYKDLIQKETGRTWQEIRRLIDESL